mmetsp:Transcript_22857/g.58521  ORF Transcript_22857/g.58521 Transcript_22857/m.58521 type:complete len:428 (+) Transcript_22857:330-1613(+)
MSTSTPQSLLRCRRLRYGMCMCMCMYVCMCMCMNVYVVPCTTHQPSCDCACMARPKRIMDMGHGHAVPASVPHSADCPRAEAASTAEAPIERSSGDATAASMTGSTPPHTIGNASSHFNNLSLCPRPRSYLPTVCNLCVGHHLMLGILQHTHKLIVLEAPVAITIEVRQQMRRLIRRHLRPRSINLAGDRHARARECVQELLCGDDTVAIRVERLEHGPHARMPLEERLAQPRQQHALPLRERLDTHIAHGRRDLAGARRARCAFAHTLGSGGDGGRAACLATQGEEVRHRYYRPNIATSVIEAALASQQGGRASWADRVEQLTAEGSKGRRVHAVALTRVALLNPWLGDTLRERAGRRGAHVREALGERFEQRVVAHGLVHSRRVPRVHAALVRVRLGIDAFAGEGHEASAGHGLGRWCGRRLWRR